VRHETLLQRLAGRRTCPKCGTVYNVYSLNGATTCPKEGAELFQRPDDKEEVIGKRLEVYAKQTQPLIEYYSKLGLLRKIAGEGALDDVFERMEAAALARPVPTTAVKVTKARPQAKKAGAQKSAKKSLPKPARKSAKKPVRKAAKKKTKAAAKTGKKAAVRKTVKNQSRKAVKKPISKVAKKRAKPARKK
jgi:adenylate kinase